MRVPGAEVVVGGEGDAASKPAEAKASANRVARMLIGILARRARRETKYLMARRHQEAPGRSRVT